MDVGRLNLEWASELIGTLVDSGVTGWVISPGSRSTPLALACRQFEGLKIAVLPDERSAAFFALGMARSSGAPAGVIATSGSAPANWFPAVIEASRDLLPLVLVSADRPAELQHCGANQTIDQNRLFGAHVRGFIQLPHVDPAPSMFRRVRFDAARAADLSRWPHPGPVHVNVPFREPLVPERAACSNRVTAGSVSEPAVVGRPRVAPASEATARISAALGGRPGLIICGRGQFGTRFHDRVCALGDRLNCPVLADPLSGLRFGSHRSEHVVSHYDTFLRPAEISGEWRPEWVLRFGGTPVSRTLERYLREVGEAMQILVSPSGDWSDPTLGVAHVVHADPAETCAALLEAAPSPGPGEWQKMFLEAEHRERKRLEEGRELPVEAQVIRTVLSRSPGGTRVFCGNSTVIRDVDSFSGTAPYTLELTGNRGASGIDGNVSTVMGMSAASAGPVVGLLGDLALYHDMNGLIAARDLDVTLVVFNNGGGAIFSYLPQADLPAFERFWLTPTGLDPGRIAALYGITHCRVEDAKGFGEAFSRSLSGPGASMIEVLIDRVDSVRRHREFWSGSGG